MKKYRKIKTFLPWLAAAMILTAFCPAIPSAAEEVWIFLPEDEEQETVGIADPDEVIVIPNGNNQARIYDWQGNYVNTIPFYFEPGESIFKPKEAVVTCWGDQKLTVYSMENGEVLMTLDHDRYTVQRSKDMFVTLDRETGEVRLYNYMGELLYTDTFSLNPDIKRGTAAVVRLEHGAVIYLDCWLDEGEEMIPNPVFWVSDDGSAKIIMDMELQDNLMKGGGEAFGDYLAVSNWDTDQKYTINSNGEMVGPYWSRFVHQYDANYNGAIAVGLAEEGGQLVAYDCELNRISEVSDQVNYPECKEGFLSGVWYEELGNEMCSGFLEYDGFFRTVPYAYKGAIYVEDEDGDLQFESAEGCYVWMENRTIFIPLEYQKMPVGINENLIMIRDVKTKETEIKRIDTGEVIWNSQKYGSNVRVSLGSGYCLIRDYNKDNCCILDLTGQVVYESLNSVSMMEAGHGLIHMYRGIYNGLIDCNGEWVIKVVMREE